MNWLAANPVFHPVHFRPKLISHFHDASLGSAELEEVKVLEVVKLVHHWRQPFFERIDLEVRKRMTNDVGNLPCVRKEQ